MNQILLKYCLLCLTKAFESESLTCNSIYTFKEAKCIKNNKYQDLLLPFFALNFLLKFHNQIDLVGLVLYSL